ncbi:MAG: hypothetical protein HC767_06420 [Akkermansiaceae bacterium]|nr:hypothetical protein [Akkermansiaceae bacterium]
MRDSLLPPSNVTVPRPVQAPAMLSRMLAASARAVVNANPANAIAHAALIRNAAFKRARSWLAGRNGDTAAVMDSVLCSRSAALIIELILFGFGSA